MYSCGKCHTYEIGNDKTQGMIIDEERHTERERQRQWQRLRQKQR